MRNFIVALLFSFILAPIAVFADCPDGKYKCPNGKTITYGQCWDGFLGCKPCDSSYKKKCKKHNPSCSPSVRSRADGCSAPVDDPESKALKSVFKEACNNHDMCYATLGASKKNCDEIFHKEMLEACKKKKPGDPLCPPGALVWYWAVLAEGGEAFRINQNWAKKHCK